MELGKNNLSCENEERVIATFDFSNDKAENSVKSCIGEMKQSEFPFKDGFEENF